MKDGVVTKMTEVLSDDGQLLSGSTVASLYKDAMLVGTVQHKLLYCEVRWMDWLCCFVFPAANEYKEVLLYGICSCR